MGTKKAKKIVGIELEKSDVEQAAAYLRNVVLPALHSHATDFEHDERAQRSYDDAAGLYQRLVQSLEVAS